MQSTLTVLEWIASGSTRIASPRQAWIILFEPELNHRSLPHSRK